MKNIEKEFNDLKKLKIFEFKVLDLRTQEEDYLTFNLSIFKDTLRAEHVATNQTEEESNLIAYTSVELDTRENLYHHLEGLLDECVNKITNSDFYELLD